MPDTLPENPWDHEEALAFEELFAACAEHEAALESVGWASRITGTTDGDLVFTIVDETGEAMATATDVADYHTLLIGFSLALVATRRLMPARKVA